MTLKPLFVGVDLGTSSLKCGLFDPAGNCAGAARIDYPTRVVEDGAEQDCGHWYSALSQGIRLAARQVDRGRIVAIGIGGHAPSPVVVDSHLQPVGPVLPWFDGRSSSQREQILQRLGHEPRDGAERLMVGLSARALWLRGASPGQFAYARSILHSADYLIARLTGQTITSSPKAAAVLVAADLPLELIAERYCQPGEIVGQLSADAAKQFELSTAVVVVAGGLDSFLASIGSGICQPGDACLSVGSSAIVALLRGGGPAGRFQWANCQLHSQPIRPGGSALQWARQLAAPDAKLDDLILAAADLPPSPRPAECFADWIGTGRSTDSQVQRELAELAHSRSAPELIRLLLEAVFLAQQAVLTRLEGQGGPAKRIRSVGRLASHPTVNQLQADVLGRAIEVPRVTDSGALGAAMLAAGAWSHFTPPHAAAQMAEPGRIYSPRG